MERVEQCDEELITELSVLRNSSVALMLVRGSHCETYNSVSVLRAVRVACVV